MVPGLQQIISLKEIEEATQYLRSRADFQPRVGMILGSGLGGLADDVSAVIKISTAEVPGWPRSTIEGHSGKAGPAG